MPDAATRSSMTASPREVSAEPVAAGAGWAVAGSFEKAVRPDSTATASTFAGLPPISVRGPVRRGRRYHLTKRAVDVVMGSLLLVVTSPVFAVIAIAIKSTSRGPIFFRQLRVGTRRQVESGVETWVPVPLVIYKFRSMTTGVDESAHVRHVQLFTHGSLVAQSGTYKLINDSRITPVGRVLRRTSLDELPQLVNVLKGGMSMVGPRPVPVYEVASYLPHHCRRLAARPGLTGLPQVRGRGRLSHEEFVALDVEMISRRSLLFELKLLFLTVPAVVRGRGAS